MHAQNKLELLEREHVQILVYKVHGRCFYRDDIVGKRSCARHQRDKAINNILDKHTR